jgi:uncharacterized surface protein with fasciclin (FAS1) repeats
MEESIMSILRIRSVSVLAITVALGASLAACSGSSSSGTPGSTASSPAAASNVDFGSGCASVPNSGAGSFSGMEQAQVATAASANPVLSTLVAGVTKAGLGDTLNNASGITVFAPANSAFAKIPAATLAKILKNKKELTSILTYHVLPVRLSPSQLAGTHKTLEGGTLTVTGSGTSFTVNGSTSDPASVVCGNVQTANATVYIISSVLRPPTS